MAIFINIALEQNCWKEGKLEILLKGVSLSVGGKGG